MLGTVYVDLDKYTKVSTHSRTDSFSFKYIINIESCGELCDGIYEKLN